MMSLFLLIFTQYTLFNLSGCVMASRYLRFTATITTGMQVYIYYTTLTCQQ